MNRTFKVVFNYVRDCMIVANEMTRSFKKKSAKTVIATTVTATLLSLGAASQAANTGGSSEFLDIDFSSSSGTAEKVCYGNDVSSSDTKSNYSVFVDTGTTKNEEVAIRDRDDLRVYGAYAYIPSSVTTIESIDISNNSVTMSTPAGSSQQRASSVYASRAHVVNTTTTKASANSSTVAISNFWIEGNTLYTNRGIHGGFAHIENTVASDVTAETLSNEVSISDGSKLQDYVAYTYGGRAEAMGKNTVTASANLNKVKFTDSKMTLAYDPSVNLYGGKSYAHGVSKSSYANKASASSIGNEVTFSNSSSESSVYGASALSYYAKEMAATAKDNTVNIGSESSIAYVCGGYSKSYSGGASYVRDVSTAIANHNSVSISGESTIGQSLTGYADAQYGKETTSSANENITTLEGSSSVAELYGSYAISTSECTDSSITIKSEANKNEVTVSDSSVSSAFYGGFSFAKEGYSGSATTEAISDGNTIKINDGATIGSEADSCQTIAAFAWAVGHLTADASAKENTVSISGGSQIYGGIYGAETSTDTEMSYQATASATSNLNKVSIANSTVTTNDVYGIVGGKSRAANCDNATAQASENTVEITSQAQITSYISGGHAIASIGTVKSEATATKNTVTLSDVTFNSSSSRTNKIHAGYAEAAGGSGSYENATEANATASNNKLFISGNSSITGTIYGGYALTDYATDSSALASNNEVTISDNSAITGDIFGGYLNTHGNATATNNTVDISGNFSLTNTSLYGGYSQFSTTGTVDIFTGNTLNLDARNVSTVSVKKVANFETINLQAGDVHADSIVLATEGTSLGVDGDASKGTTVKLTRVGAGSVLNENEKVILISNASGTLTNDGESLFIYKGDSTVNGYDATVKLDGTDVIALIEGETINVDSDTSGTKVVNENRVAGVAFINSGTDLLLAIDEQEGPTFGSIQGGHKRYKTGSHVDVDGINFATGYAHTFKRQSSKTTAGVFVEAGYGDISTHNTIAGNKLKGDGNSKYVGVGFLARHDFTEGALKGFYTRAAVRAGRLFTDYSNKEALNGASFDLDSNYYAGHAGFGYQKDLTNTIQLDARAQYMFSCIKGKNVAILSDTYNFKDTYSHRTRLGVRFNYTANPRVNPFVSFAWEHEFDGKAKSTVNGHVIDGADLTGSSGIVKLGLTIKPSKESGLSLDAGVAGFFGQQKGINGEIRVQYLF